MSLVWVNMKCICKFVEGGKFENLDGKFLIERKED